LYNINFYKDGDFYMSTIKTTKMSFNDIIPNVRYVQHITLHPEVPPFHKMLYDHRITYVCGGKGSIEVEDIPYSCKKGDLFYWGPEVKYAVHRDTVDPLTLLNIHFDFTPFHKDKKFAPPAVLIQNFIPEMITEKIEFSDMTELNCPFHIMDYYQGESGLLQIIEEYKMKKIFYLQNINGMLLSFLISLARYLSVEKNKKKDSHKIAEQVINYIHAHYNEPLTNSDISKVFNFHPNYINRLIHSYTGISLHQYVLNVKLHKASEMLHSSSVSITKIAQELGFSDISHFSKAFKNKLGYNPTEIR
jgi:AraC-like DNA-binding protein